MTGVAAGPASGVMTAMTGPIPCIALLLTRCPAAVMWPARGPPPAVGAHGVFAAPSRCCGARPGVRTPAHGRHTRRFQDAYGAGPAGAAGSCDTATPATTRWAQARPEPSRKLTPEPRSGRAVATGH